MNESIKNSVATILIWNYAAIIVNVIAFMILYMKANKNISLKAFFRVQISMIIWLVGKVLKTVSPTVDIRWAFIVFYYFGINLLSASFLDFAYIYNKGKPMNRIFRFLVYAISVFDFIIVFTNPYHYRFYARYGFWGDSFGSLFYVQLVVNYLFILIGMIYCIKRFRKQVYDKGKLEKNLIGIAIIAPLLFNLIYITRLLEALFDYLKIPVFDITPIVYTWSILIFVYATFRYEFFDLTPLMKHEITSRLYTPILIMDQNFKFLYSNKRFRKIFRNPENLVDKILQGEQSIIEEEGKYYIYTQNMVNNLGNAKYIITINDVSSYHSVNEMLYKENQGIQKANGILEEQIELLKQTSHIGARNYVARELHDIIGHSLVVSMKLLEVCKLSYYKNREKARNSLKNAKETLLLGMEEMEAVKEKETGVILNSESLEREIRTMLRTVDISGLTTNFFVRGNCNSLSEKMFDIIKKILMELVTNSLKHGNASTLFISIMFQSNGIEINFMDNGKGVSSLIKGNGLKGIDFRLTLVQGNAEYETSEGNGFQVKIKIPRKD